MSEWNHSDESGLIKRVFTDRAVRQRVTSESHYWFFTTYFADYIKYPTADFQRELFKITEDESLPLAVIVAFRGSAKSTIVTMSYPIWAIVGKQQKKFVVIASQTQYQARMHLVNIKRELESNELLANDLGPFVEQREEWGSTSLFIPKYNARITAISTEQSVRGIRHGATRPDLIIADDVEDSNSVRTREGRNKTYDWYTGEIIPAGDIRTKRIAIGNLLHEDSLLMRLKERINKGEIDGEFFWWPIMHGDAILWLGKYPDLNSIEKQRREIGNRISWEREYMLRIVSDEDQVIETDWIKYYDELPEFTKDNEYINSFVSVDLAISQKSTADNTAIVVIHAFGYKPEDRKYYIDHNFINAKLTHLSTLDTIHAIYANLKAQEKEQDFKEEPRALIESVQYQEAVVEQLKEREVKAIGVKVHLDKRSRLQLASPLFEQGKVFLPDMPKAKVISQQIVGFGVERYDDLVDAVSMGLNYIHTKVQWGPGVSIINLDRNWNVTNEMRSWRIKYVE